MNGRTITRTLYGLVGLCLVSGLPLAAVQAGQSIDGAGTAGESRQAYRFELEDINPRSRSHGKRIHLDELRAERGVVLNFIASWCGPCWTEVPSFEKLHESDKTPIVFVAADEHGPTDDLLRLAARARLTLPILHVPKDRIEFMEQHYDHGMLPSTYVIDKHGAILGMLPGVIPETLLFEEIRRHFR